jgi:hypothetical protein
MRRSLDEQVVRQVLSEHHFIDRTLCLCGRTFPTYDRMVGHQIAAMKVLDLEASNHASAVGP